MKKATLQSRAALYMFYVKMNYVYGLAAEAEQLAKKLPDGVAVKVKIAHLFLTSCKNYLSREDNNIITYW